jgi:Fe-S oxidoreductase
MLEDKQELSARVAGPLIQKVRAQTAGGLLVASGTSCRHQVEHLAGVRMWHMAEVLHKAMTNDE